MLDNIDQECGSLGRFRRFSGIVVKGVMPTLLVMIILSGIVTLPVSPMPWFDEVYIASVTESFLETRKLALGINPLRDTQELTYGPVFFFLQATCFNVLGVGAVQSRLVGFLAGIGIAFLLYRLLRSWELPKHFCLVAMTLLLSDYAFGRGMYSGRMDLVATFLLMLAVLVIETTRDRHLVGLAVAGVVSGLAVLTTPTSVYAEKLVARDRFSIRINRDKRIQRT